jgi:hypothetical protein
MRAVVEEAREEEVVEMIEVDSMIEIKAVVVVVVVQVRTHMRAQAGEINIHKVVDRVVESTVISLEEVVYLLVLVQGGFDPLCMYGI